MENRCTRVLEEGEGGIGTQEHIDYGRLWM